MGIVSSIVGNLGAGVVGRFVSSLGPIILVPLLVRTWGMEVYGEWLVLTAVPTYIMMAPDFGLAGAVVNRMAMLTAGNERKEAVFLYRSSWVVLFLAAAGFVGLGWVLAGILDASKLGVHGMGAGRSTAIIGLSCMQIFVSQQLFLLSGIYRCARKNPRNGVMNSLSALVMLVAGIISLVFGADPLKYLLVILGAQAGMFAIIVLDTRRIMPDFTLGLEGVAWTRVKPYVVPGLGHAGMPLVHAFQNQGVLLVLGGISGPANVAIFQTVRTMVNGIKSLLGLLSSAVGAELPMLLGEAKGRIVEQLIIKNVQISLCASLLAITSMSLFGQPLYQLWIGKTVSSGHSVMIILLVSLIPYAVALPSSTLLLASNQIHKAIGPMILVAVLSVGGVALVAAFQGLRGAAVAVVFWEVGLAVVVVRVMFRSFDRGSTPSSDYISQILDFPTALADARCFAASATKRIAGMARVSNK